MERKILDYYLHNSGMSRWNLHVETGYSRTSLKRANEKNPSEWKVALITAVAEGLGKDVGIVTTDLLKLESMSDEDYNLYAMRIDMTKGMSALDIYLHDLLKNGDSYISIGNDVEMKIRENMPFPDLYTPTVKSDRYLLDGTYMHVEIELDNFNLTGRVLRCQTEKDYLQKKAEAEKMIREDLNE